jgi:hypothetical protein
MSTILMAILIIALTIILPWIFIARHNKTVKKQEQENFRRFSAAGSDKHLSFSRQEVIQNKIIGFDGIKQTLMIFELNNDYDVTCIAIKELAQCTVDKEYYSGANNDAANERILKEIRLVFHFLDKRPVVKVVFYSNHNDSIYLMADMESKAKEWQSAILKMVPKPAAAIV